MNVGYAKARQPFLRPLRRFIELGGSGQPWAVAVGQETQMVHHLGSLESLALDFVDDVEIALFLRGQSERKSAGQQNCGFLHSEYFIGYSYRRASMGSSRAALIAGNKPAINPTSSRTPVETISAKLVMWRWMSPSVLSLFIIGPIRGRTSIPL